MQNRCANWKADDNRWETCQKNRQFPCINCTTSPEKSHTELGWNLWTAASALQRWGLMGEEEGVHQQRLLEALILRPVHKQGQQPSIVGHVLEVQSTRHLHQVGVATVLVPRPRTKTDSACHQSDQQHPVQTHRRQQCHQLGQGTCRGDEDRGPDDAFVKLIHLDCTVGEQHLQVVDGDLLESLKNQFGVFFQAYSHHNTLVILHRWLDWPAKGAVDDTLEEGGLRVRLLTAQHPETKDIIAVWVDTDLNGSNSETKWQQFQNGFVLCKGPIFTASSVKLFHVDCYCRHWDKNKNKNKNPEGKWKVIGDQRNSAKFCLIFFFFSHSLIIYIALAWESHIFCLDTVAVKKTLISCSTHLIQISALQNIIRTSVLHSTFSIHQLPVTTCTKAHFFLVFICLHFHSSPQSQPSGLFCCPVHLSSLAIISWYITDTHKSCVSSDTHKPHVSSKTITKEVNRKSKPPKRTSHGVRTAQLVVCWGCYPAWCSTVASTLLTVI